MSVSFLVKNNNKNILTVKETLSLTKENIFSKQNIEQFSFDQNAQGFDLNYFYNSPMSDFNFLLLGSFKKSARGFEFAYEKDLNAYSVRVFTPSTSNDWLVALNFLKFLSKKMNTDIHCENGQTFTSSNISNFDYKSDINYGINSMFPNEDFDTSYSQGIFCTVAFNKEIIDKILSSPSPIEEFDNFFYSIQYLDAFCPNQLFYKNEDNDKIFGVYSITQNTANLIPYSPSVDLKNSDFIKDEQINHWEVSLVRIDGDENNPDSYSVAGAMLYPDFIKALPKDKYRFVDAASILVEPLSQQELLTLLNTNNND